MITHRLCMALLVASMLGACASYEPSSATLPAKTAHDLVEASGVYAGARPYTDAKDQEATFDADLDKSDVIALHAFVENRRASSVLIRPSDAALRLADGRAIAPSSASKVATKVGEEGSVIGATLAFGIIGMIAASNAEEKARAARIDDYQSKSLHTTELKPGDKAQGVIFFIPPKSWPAFDAAELALRAVDPETGESWVVPVGLTGLRYVPGKPEK